MQIQDADEFLNKELLYSPKSNSAESE